MSAFYNENDPFAAAWLRKLIEAGHIAPGVVDERSIEELTEDDLEGFTQVHFFAGIGGWSYALRLAGWDDGQSVWTGSCPCQPFSSAGRAGGLGDKRHLWPAFHRLIAKCNPAIVFGEQVASKDGRVWLAGVRVDLEALGYAVGSADLCAAGVGAPHIRQRLYWLAHAERAGVRRKGRRSSGSASSGMQEANRQRQRIRADARAINNASASRVADTDIASEHGRASGGQQSIRNELPDRTQGLEHAEHRRSTVEEQGPQSRRAGGNETDRLGDTAAARLQGQWGEYRPRGERCSGLAGFAMQDGVPEWNGPTIAIECADGPRRASAEPDSFPLAHGVPARMGKLRGSGNAICPQTAQEFILASMEALQEGT